MLKIIHVELDEANELVARPSYTPMNAKTKFRPDLTSYRPYIQALTDKLNEDALFKMSDTDAVKLAIEKAVKELLPDVVIVKQRKIYQRLRF